MDVFENAAICILFSSTNQKSFSETVTEVEGAESYNVQNRDDVKVELLLLFLFSSFLFISPASSYSAKLDETSPAPPERP
jgi:hypothetical protein